MGLETLLAVGLGAAVAGQTMSAIQGSQAARYGAAAAEQEASLARQTAGIEADRIRREGRRIIGAQRAAAAASGLDPGAGSPLLVALETSRLAEEDALLARWKGDVRAKGLQEEARLRRAQGRQALIRGILGVGGEVLQYRATTGLLRTRGLLNGGGVPTYRGGFD